MTVLVVGAGPTGLTVAALLGQRGIACVVVDRWTEAYGLPRAVHLDDECLRILQEIGVAERLVTRPALGLRLVDAHHRTMAQFDRRTGRFGYPQANMFEQPDLERLLRERLAELPCVDLREGTELIALDGSLRDTSTGDVTQVPYRYLLGCDGAASTVRELAGIGWRERGFEDRWLVVDGRQATPLGTWDGVVQVCDPARAATFMQVSADHYRWEFRLHEGESADGIDLAALLRRWPVSPDLEVVRRAEYVFRAGVADTWRQGNVLLLGDAAHQTPPFIGQGLGLGLRDAANVAWKFERTQLLDTYESERRPHAEALIKKAVVVGWALTGGQGAASAVRRRALAALCRYPGLMSRAFDRDTPALRRGPLVATGFRSLAGQLIPQPTKAFDTELGSGFALVVLHPPRAAVAAAGRALGARQVLAPPAVAEWMRRGRTTAVLVRPDRVVLAAAGRRGHLSRAGRVAVATATT